MEVFQHTAIQMFILAVIVICGFIARKKSLMNDTFDTMLSQLVFNITLPALILNSVLSSESLPSAHDIGFTLLYASLYFVLTITLSLIIGRLIYRKMPKVTRGAHEFMMVFGNTGFIGYAVLASVLDPSAVLYAAIYNIIFNIVIFSVGVMLISGTVESDDERRGWRKQLGAVGHALLKPAVIASSVAAVLAIFEVNAPGSPIQQACDLLGGMTVPAAMLVVGSSIAKMPLHDIFTERWSYLTTAIRLFAVPLVVFFVFGLFVHDSFILAILVLLAGMPVASNGTMLSLAYSGDTKTVARVTFLTTVLSVITLPLVALLVV